MWVTNRPMRQMRMGQLATRSQKNTKKLAGADFQRVASWRVTPPKRTARDVLFSQLMTTRKVGRWVLRVVLAIVLLSALAAVGCVIFFNTDRGRRFAADHIESFVSANIPGKLRIGSIEQFHPGMVLASDVRFYHPDGRLILLCKHAEIVPDLAMALHGKIGFESAAVDGGFLLLTIDPDGRISIESTMNSPSKPGEHSDPHGGAHYWLRSMHTQHFTTTFSASGHTFRLQDTLGYVALRRIETQGTQVTLAQISGRLEQEIAGAHIAFNNVDGWIHGKEKHVAHFDADTRVGDGKLRMAIDYFDRPKTPMRVQLQKSKGLDAVAFAWLMRVAAGFTDAIQVDG